MKRMNGMRWISVAALIGVLSVCGRTDVAAEQVMEPATILQVSGKIASLDTLNRKLILEVAQGASQTPQQIEFVISADTTISQRGIPLKFEDLQVSDEQVTIQYRGQEHPAVAQAITFAKPAGLKHLSGTIERIDAVKGELTVKPTVWFWKGGPMTVILDETTLMAQGRERTYLTNLRIGDEVSVEYRMDHDQRRARFVDVLSRAVTPSLQESQRNTLEPQREAPRDSGYVPAKQ